MKYTQATLAKLEKGIEEAGYLVRFERGNFQSGFCILEEKRVVVLNKFLPLEGRINTLIDLLPQLQINAEVLSPKAKNVRTGTSERAGQHKGLMRRSRFSNLHLLRAASPVNHYVLRHRHQQRRTHDRLRLCCLHIIR
jgi:hypothetical protein